MTSVNYFSGDNPDKHIAKIVSSSKVRVTITTRGRPTSLYYREEQPQNGGRGRGSFRRVKDFFIDKENLVYVGYSKEDKENDPGYQFTEYAAIGRLIVVESLTQ